MKDSAEERDRAQELRQRLGEMVCPLLRELDMLLDKRWVATFFATLQALVTHRYQKGSIVLTSNKSYADWGDIFADSVLASALLDRLLHQSVTVNIRGGSHRLKDKLRSAPTPEPLLQQKEA